MNYIELLKSIIPNPDDFKTGLKQWFAKDAKFWGIALGMHVLVLAVLGVAIGAPVAKKLLQEAVFFDTEVDTVVEEAAITHFEVGETPIEPTVLNTESLTEPPSAMEQEAQNNDNNPVFEEYAEALSARLGEQRANDVLSVSRFNSIIYPNCSFMSQFRQLRIVHPIAADRTVVYTYSFRMKGAPPALFQDTVAFGNVVNGTASWVLTDDLEVYERAQKGLTGQLSDWVYLGRGFGRDRDDEHEMQRGDTGTSEIHIRGQFAAWKHYMTGTPA